MSAEIQPRPPRVLITNTVALNMGDAAILEGAIEIVRPALGRDTRPPSTTGARRSLAATTRSSGSRHPVGSPGGGKPPRKGICRVGAEVAAVRRRLVLRARAGHVTRLWLGDRERAEASARYAGADLVVSTSGTYLVENYALEPRISDYELTLLTRSPHSCSSPSRSGHFGTRATGGHSGGSSTALDWCCSATSARSTAYASWASAPTG